MPSCSRGFCVARTRKGSGSGWLISPDSHLSFLHGFQQSALHLGGRSIDFVSEDEVREDRAFFDAELTRARMVDLGADHVGGQQVGCELHPLKTQAQGSRQCSHRQCFR